MGIYLAYHDSGRINLSLDPADREILAEKIIAVRHKKVHCFAKIMFAVFFCKDKTYKLKFFNNFLTFINQNITCFQNLKINATESDCKQSEFYF